MCLKLAAVSQNINRFEWKASKSPESQTFEESDCLEAGWFQLPLTASNLFSDESMAAERNPLLEDFVFPPFDVIEPKHIRPAFRSFLAKLVSCILRLSSFCLLRKLRKKQKTKNKKQKNKKEEEKITRNWHEAEIFSSIGWFISSITERWLWFSVFRLSSVWFLGKLREKKKRKKEGKKWKYWASCFTMFWILICENSHHVSKIIFHLFSTFSG